MFEDSLLGLVGEIQYCRLPQLRNCVRRCRHQRIYGYRCFLSHDRNWLFLGVQRLQSHPLHGADPEILIARVHDWRQPLPSLVSGLHCKGDKGKGQRRRRAPTATASKDSERSVIVSACSFAGMGSKSCKDEAHCLLAGVYHQESELNMKAREKLQERDQERENIGLLGEETKGGTR